VSLILTQAVIIESPTKNTTPQVCRQVLPGCGFDVRQISVTIAFSQNYAAALMAA
jgi:hypothetical protein